MSFHTVQARGYFLRYSIEPINEFNKLHYFCGPHEIEGAYCPNCRKPLLKFFSIDLNDPRLCFRSTLFTKLSLFFCWTCNIAQELFYYKVINDSSIHIIKYGKGGVETDFPYPDYPTYFPGHPCILEEIPDKTQRILSMLNNGQVDEFDIEKKEPLLCKPRHQLGGEPYLVQQEAEIVHCPECEKKMPFLASIGDNCGDPRGFTGNEYVQVLYFYCKQCGVIGALQECD